MSVQNTATTRTGKVRPICQTCGKRGQAVELDETGRIHLWDLARGWSTAPYPEDFEHSDGSRGSTYTCPECGGRLLAGEALSPDLHRGGRA